MFHGIEDILLKLCISQSIHFSGNVAPVFYAPDSLASPPTLIVVLAHIQASYLFALSVVFLFAFPPPFYVRRPGLSLPSF